MSKRVTLSYTIDLEDLEHEVNRLYTHAMNNLSIEKSTWPQKLTLTSDACETIEGARQTLAKINVALSEVQQIISSYVSYKINPEPPVPPIDAATFEKLQQNINSIEELVNRNDISPETDNGAHTLDK